MSDLYATLSKRLQYKCFPVNIYFYRTPPVTTSETKHIQASAADLLDIRIGNLDWCKWRNRKNEAREIEDLCCREVDAMLIITSAKIPEREGSISPSSFYGQLPDR